MTKQKKYCVQKLVEDKEKRLKIWVNTNRCNHDLEALKMVCVRGQRIFDRETGKVVYEC